MGRKVDRISVIAFLLTFVDLSTCERLKLASHQFLSTLIVSTLVAL